MNSDTLQAGLPPANDRMLTTCFLAAVFHGIIILGVTFSSTNRDEAASDAPALQVVLVNGHAPESASNPDARYLAQRSQRGSGNTLSAEPTLVPRSSPAPLEQRGTPGGAGLASLKAGPDAGSDELIASSAPALRILYFAPPANAPESSAVPEVLENRPELDMTPNDEGIELRLRGESEHRLWIAADTRASDVAVYLDGWRRKIERVGTLNFPDVARRRKLSGTPVIEVTIGDDGRLLKSVIRHSSGHVEIDEAALRILKLAAPYERFPGAMRAKHDQIRIAYEWQFLGGGPSGSSVSYAEPRETP